jgi:hypothetical protein
MVNVWSKQSLVLLAVLALVGCADQRSQNNVMLAGQDGVAGASAVEQHAGESGEAASAADTKAAEIVTAGNDKATAGSAQAVKKQEVQPYAPSSKVVSVQLHDTGWPGSHSFNDVYCLNFPEPEKAMALMERFYAHNTVHLARVSYQGNMMINVVASTLPPGRTPEAEMEELADYLQQSEKVSGRNHHINKEFGVFGTVLTTRINNLAPASQHAPYPLVHAFLPDDTLESISVSRLFVRGADRFEIALYQLAPQDAGAVQEAAMVNRLERLADDALSSFEICTALLPLHEFVPLPVAESLEPGIAAEPAAIPDGDAVLLSPSTAAQ